MTHINPASSSNEEAEKIALPNITMPSSFDSSASELRNATKITKPTLFVHRTHRSSTHSAAIPDSHVSPCNRSFIDFIRCLRQAKAIVKELQSFSVDIFPAINLSSDFYDHLANSNQYAQQVLCYVNSTFSKFSRLCKILLMVLSKMEAERDTPKERLVSFRAEIREEWRLATEIKEHLLSFIQLNAEHISTPGYSPSSTSSSSSTPLSSPAQAVADL